MRIDYHLLLPVALRSLYPEEQKRNEVKQLLETYGTESFHREKSRVRLGVLYLASRDPGSLESFIELACTDYRDLLCAAEYPYSSRRWGLQEKDPEKYRKLRAKEEKEYLAWVQSIGEP
jgi:hypothetical protein